jgi:hypothetical protein
MEIDGLKMQLSMVEEGSSPAPCNINHKEIEEKQKKLEADIKDLKE